MNAREARQLTDRFVAEEKAREVPLLEKRIKEQTAKLLKQAHELIEAAVNGGCGKGCRRDIAFLNMRGNERDAREAVRAALIAEGYSVESSYNGSGVYNDEIIDIPVVKPFP